MAIKADQRDYNKAFTRHLHAYLHWGDAGSDISKRLVLIYCVECGLKCMLMKSKKIFNTDEAQQDVAADLHSHDFLKLLKRLDQAGTYSFPPIETTHGDKVTAPKYHEFCRYSVHSTPDSYPLVQQYDSQLNDIAMWLREKV